MSEFREFLLQQLEAFPSRFPHTRMRIWAALETDQLAAVRLRFNLDAPQPKALMINEAVANVEAALAQPDHPLRTLPPEQINTVCHWALEEHPHDPRVQARIIAVLALTDLRAKAAATARTNAAKPRKSKASSIQPYVDIWVGILRAKRFTTAAEQAAEFERQVQHKHLAPVSRQTRHAHKVRTLKLMSS